jgi:hypothetical protein
MIPGSASPLLTSAGGYNLTKSLRFRQSASAYLSRTPASASGENQWTFSAWVKRGILNYDQFIIGGNTTTSGGVRNILSVQFDTNSNLQVLAFTNASGYYFQRVSSAVYRDPSAWYHLVVQFDPDNGTSANRIIAYINGQQVSWGTSSDSGAAGSISSSAYRSINNTYRNDINGGYQGGGAPIYFGDGYLAETIMVSGSLVSVSSFGETSSTTGVWIPKKYTGTYGTNGFYLPFTDNSALTTSSNVGLGKDFSGNSNYWTTNNISLTSGSTYDSMIDVPTLTSATAANYATFNPLINIPSYNYSTLSNGNLTTVGNSAANNGVNFSTQTIKSGKWYAEFTCTGSSSTYPIVGITDITQIATNGGSPGYTSNSVGYSANGNKILVNGTQSSYGNSYTTNDVIGVAIDADNGAVYFGKQTGGTGSIVWQNSGDPTSGASKTGAAYTYTGGTIEFYIAASPYQSGTGFNANFGQQPFSATPPTGFNRLNTFNLPTPTIGATASTTANKYFDVSIYTGTGALTQSVTNSNSMQPDFVWIKDRTQSTRHVLTDSVRGSGISLYSNTTDLEGTNDSTGYLSAFNSNGFTVNRGSGGLGERVNYSGDNYVGWQWRASNAAGVTNTAGSITSTVSANTSAGFSIVTYSANGSTGTIGHGLGVTPSMIIVKKRNVAERWCVFHTSTSNAYIYLNEVFAADTTNANVRFGNNTVVVQPTNTLFTIGSSNDVNGTSGTYVAYCFAPVAGYSAFGSYTGNGVPDGPFIYTGFRPRFILIKASSFSTASTVWTIWDSKRSPSNAAVLELYPNDPISEQTDSNGIDILSNGFKPRRNSDYANSSGQTYIYMAFAENPFKYANAR